MSRYAFCFNLTKMARMYSKKKGKSGSKKPLAGKKPTWIRYTKKEIELLITKFAKEGKTTSEIGIILRDSYGIPDAKQITGKSVSAVLKEKNIAHEVPEDILALLRRSMLIRKHLEGNKHDMSALRGLQLTESKIKRLVKYYKRAEKIAPDWKYDPKTVKVYVK